MNPPEPAHVVASPFASCRRGKHDLRTARRLSLSACCSLLLLLLLRRSYKAACLSLFFPALIFSSSTSPPHHLVFSPSLHLASALISGLARTCIHPFPQPSLLTPHLPTTSLPICQSRDQITATSRAPSTYPSPNQTVRSLLNGPSCCLLLAAPCFPRLLRSTPLHS